MDDRKTVSLNIPKSAEERNASLTGSCLRCKFSGGSYIAPDHDIKHSGIKCRRHAPIVTGGMHAPTMTIWPWVDQTDWCGDFVKKEY